MYITKDNIMKKIFLHCFFLSWIFTLQAQITPDGGTNTQVNSQNGVELIDIAHLILADYLTIATASLMFQVLA